MTERAAVPETELEKQRRRDVGGEDAISKTLEAVVLDWIERYAETLQKGIAITPYSATLLINTVRHHDRAERERRIADGDQNLTDKLYAALKAMVTYAKDERKGLKIADDALHAYEGRNP